MTREELIERMEDTENVLIQTANKPEYAYIHAIARAVWIRLVRTERRMRKAGEQK